MPEDRVRRTVMVVQGLPYGSKLGAAFLDSMGAYLTSRKEEASSQLQNPNGSR